MNSLYPPSFTEFRIQKRVRYVLHLPGIGEHCNSVPCMTQTNILKKRNMKLGIPHNHERKSEYEAKKQPKRCSIQHIALVQCQIFSLKLLPQRLFLFFDGIRYIGWIDPLRHLKCKFAGNLIFDFCGCGAIFNEIIVTTQPNNNLT